MRPPFAGVDSASPSRARTASLAIGDDQNDDAILLGFLAPFTGAAPSGPIDAHALELVVDEITKTVSGLPGVDGGGPRPRPSSPATKRPMWSEPAITSWTILDVAMIVGPMQSDHLVDLANEVTIPAGVAVLSPRATSPVITTLQDNGLVWRTVCSDALQIRAYPLLVAEIEAQIRSALVLAPSDAIRLALVSRGDAWGDALAAAAVGSIVFNGKSAVDNVANYMQAKYDPEGDPRPSHRSSLCSNRTS